MAFRRAAANTAKRLARNARALSSAPRALATATAEAPAVQRLLPSQLAFARPFAAAAEPAVQPDTSGHIQQVRHRLDLARPKLS